MSDGPTGSTGATGPTESTGPTGPQPPPVITLNDILNATEVITQKETADAAALNSIGSISFDTLKASLIRWAAAGFPNAYTIHDVAVSPPGTCSDGVTRSLSDYIPYVSGKTIQEHIAVLQERVLDFDVSFAYNGSSVLIVVSKRG